MTNQIIIEYHWPFLAGISAGAGDCLLHEVFPWQMPNEHAVISSKVADGNDTVGAEVSIPKSTACDPLMWQQKASRIV